MMIHNCLSRYILNLPFRPTDGLRENSEIDVKKKKKIVVRDIRYLHS